MIIQLFIFALIFIGIGILFLARKKKLLGGMFILLAIFLSVIGVVAVFLYPQSWPF